MSAWPALRSRSISVCTACARSSATSGVAAHGTAIDARLFVSMVTRIKIAPRRSYTPPRALRFAMVPPTVHDARVDVETRTGHGADALTKPRGRMFAGRRAALRGRELRDLERGREPSRRSHVDGELPKFRAGPRIVGDLGALGLLRDRARRRTVRPRRGTLEAPSPARPDGESAEPRKLGVDRSDAPRVRARPRTPREPREHFVDRAPIRDGPRWG